MHSAECALLRLDGLSRYPDVTTAQTLERWEVKCLVHARDYTSMLVVGHPSHQKASEKTFSKVRVLPTGRNGGPLAEVKQNSSISLLHLRKDLKFPYRPNTAGAPGRSACN
jgi:hypothetical protein